jgi:hypothetical protein
MYLWSSTSKPITSLHRGLISIMVMFSSTTSHSTVYFCIQEVLVSNFGPNTNLHDRGSSWFLQMPRSYIHYVMTAFFEILSNSSLFLGHPTIGRDIVSTLKVLLNNPQHFYILFHRYLFPSFQLCRWILNGRHGVYWYNGWISGFNTWRYQPYLTTNISLDKPAQQILKGAIVHCAQYNVVLVPLFMSLYSYT